MQNVTANYFFGLIQKYTVAQKVQTQIKNESTIKDVLNHIKIGNVIKKENKQTNDTQHVLESGNTNENSQRKKKSQHK